MSNMKKNMEENNPLLQVYKKILPATAIAGTAIFLLVKLISGILAPDQLVLTVTYKDYEDGAAAQGPVRVAMDAAFEKEVKSMSERKSGFMDVLVFLEGTADKPDELAELDAELNPVEEEVPENGTYTFTYEKAKLPETIYVKSPQWWHPVNVENTPAVLLESGAKTETFAELEPFGCGDSLFEITSVETVKISSGIFNVNVTMTASGDAVPSKVKLVMEDEVFAEWDGSSELVYEKENGFADRTLVFRYNRSLREDISDLLENATVEVEEVTVCREFTDAEITSNIEGLEIVMVEE